MHLCSTFNNGMLKGLIIATFTHPVSISWLRLDPVWTYIYLDCIIEWCHSFNYSRILFVHHKSTTLLSFWPALKPCSCFPELDSLALFDQYLVNLPFPVLWSLAVRSKFSINRMDSVKLKLNGPIHTFWKTEFFYSKGKSLNSQSQLTLI